MAESDLGRVLRELKQQRGQMDRAIQALEAVVNGKPTQARAKARTRRLQASSVGEEQGRRTVGEVVPFVRGLKLSG